jgi:HJR/Mrr/RecB family endonuclease
MLYLKLLFIAAMVFFAFSTENVITASAIWMSLFLFLAYLKVQANKMPQRQINEQLVIKPIEVRPPTNIGFSYTPAEMHQRLIQTTSTMNGRQFEHWTAHMLTKLGWSNVKVKGGSGDRGIDITGINPSGQLSIIQCKHYSGRTIPPNEVRALIGTKTIHRQQRAYLITSGVFGPQCFAEVGSRPIELWDLKELAVKLVNERVEP